MLVVAIEIERLIELVIRQHERLGAWVIKSPILTVTMPPWAMATGEHKVIGCFRHPLEVAMSLRAASGTMLAEALRRWNAYNKRVLAHADYLINYSVAPREYRLQFADLCADLGCAPKTCSCVPSERHHVTVDAVPSKCMDVWEQLTERAI